MSAHISASAPIAQFKRASPPRSVGPEQRSSRCAGRLLDRGLGGDAAALKAFGAAPRPGRRRHSCHSPGKPWSSTKHSPSMGPPSRTSKRSASRWQYATRHRPVRTAHAPTLVVTVYAPLPRLMPPAATCWRRVMWPPRGSRQSRRPPISAHRRRRPQYRVRETSLQPGRAIPILRRMVASAGRSWRCPAHLPGADGSIRRTVSEAQPNSETSTRRSSSGR
jgi:hypothetical protein